MQIDPLLTKAAIKAGIFLAEGDSLPGDIYMRAYGCLVDLAHRMDTQPGLTFGETPATISMVGTTLTAMPLTQSEQEYIDGGGTLDITDRLLTPVPLIAPRVIHQGVEIKPVSMGDLLTWQEPDYFSFIARPDHALLVFYTCPGDIIVLMRDRLLVDTDPTGEVHVPVSYENYLVNALAADIATNFQLFDSVPLLTELAAKSIKDISGNNQVPRAPRHNLTLALSKYRRRG